MLPLFSIMTLKFRQIIYLCQPYIWCLACSTIEFYLIWRLFNLQVRRNPRKTRVPTKRMRVAPQQPKLPSQLLMPSPKTLPKMPSPPLRLTVNQKTPPVRRTPLNLKQKPLKTLLHLQRTLPNQQKKLPKRPRNLKNPTLSLSLTLPKALLTKKSRKRLSLPNPKMAKKLLPRIRKRGNKLKRLRKVLPRPRKTQKKVRPRKVARTPYLRPPKKKLSKLLRQIVVKMGPSSHQRERRTRRPPRKIRKTNKWKLKKMSPLSQIPTQSNAYALWGKNFEKLQNSKG